VSSQDVARSGGHSFDERAGLETGDLLGALHHADRAHPADGPVSVPCAHISSRSEFEALLIAREHGRPTGLLSRYSTMP
jgi:hypothetical protein